MIEASADVVGAFLYPDYPDDKAHIYLVLEDHESFFIYKVRYVI